jgi:hypothetical protein
VTAPHPLLSTLLAAVDGNFPPVDGGITIMPPLRDGWECVVSFTGHAAIATSQSRATILEHGADGFAGALAPDFLRWLAGTQGFIGVIDVTLFGRGTGTSRLPLRSDLEDHPRVQYARKLRTAVAVHGDERGLITLADGLAGRREMSVEAAPAGQGHGWGRSLIVEALGLVPAGELVFAAVSPGNARSLRAFLGKGFTPIGSEIVFHPDRREPS